MLPPFAHTALLLDLDGTLIDLAPTPNSVVLPPGLTDTLRALEAALDGALAIVTGRAIEVLDRILGHTFAAAGEHGGALRPSAATPIQRPNLPAAPGAWLNAAAALVAAHPGTLLERKARGFAVHFRQAPEAGPAIHAALIALITEDPGFQLLRGLMLWEIRPAGADKGTAVRALMAHPPFRGRLPLFIGDDVTDEDAISACRTMGGAGLRVDAAFGTPAGVRAWLVRAAELHDWTEPP